MNYHAQPCPSASFVALWLVPNPDRRFTPALANRLDRDLPVTALGA
jgi:hypothetical protein